MPEDIDAVFTWVDDSDPAFRAALLRHAPDGCDRWRYRNNGELRFSLRSLFCFAPWMRRIHVLTNGQVPPWLDRSHPRIHFVTHQEVFPAPEYLPTFNSNAIEMCLHRIPGLSRRFLYFNDDVFLGGTARPADFFPDGGGQVLYAQDTPLPADRSRGSARDRACAHTQNVLTELWKRPGEPRLLPAHAPQAYDRDVLAYLETKLHDEFRETASHRFRAPEDLVLAVLYAYTLLEADGERGRHRMRVLRSPSPDYFFLMLEKKPLWIARAYLAILRKRPRFFAINDDLGDVPPYHPVLLGMRALLRLYFPRPAPMERRTKR